jgi:hypothetical protein
MEQVCSVLIWWCVFSCIVSLQLRDFGMVFSLMLVLQQNHFFISLHSFLVNLLLFLRKGLAVHTSRSYRVIDTTKKWYIITPWIHYWYRLITIADTNIGGLTSDTNNILLVVAVLRRPILKIGVLLGIGLLSGATPILWFFLPANISSSYEILPAHFLWRLLKSAATKKVKYVLIFVMWLSIIIHFSLL